MPMSVSPRIAGRLLVAAAGIADRRLRNQRITGARHRRPADVVAWCGAVQAQEFEPAKWALGLRMQDGALNAEIDRAFARGQILRTHVLRPTWHFVTPADIRWLLELTAPRIQRSMAPYNRRLDLDARTLSRGARVLERSLRDGQQLTRAELRERLERARLAMTGARLAQLLMHAELDGVICSGPRRGRQFTYALLAERAPRARRLGRDEALAELTRRYFTSHGPATLRDFAWWSGLRIADGKRGVEINTARREEAGGLIYWSIDTGRTAPLRHQRVHLLPIYDEYLNAYRDRDAVPHGPRVVTGRSGESVAFQHAILLDGQVAGTWRVSRTPDRLIVAATLFRPLAGRARRALIEAAERFERFQGKPVEFAIS
jgi:hypothetical protein